jgi:membrane protein implicated in regulation of membrane protease activity
MDAGGVMKIIEMILNNAGLLIFGIILIVGLFMLINPTVMLQGLSTGIGVILAQELWRSFNKYRERITKHVLNEVEG